MDAPPYGEPRLTERGILPHDAPVLPLGGEGMEHGDHKGYGLALTVDLLCSLLGGTDLLSRTSGSDRSSPPGAGHFFGAIKVAGFRDPADIFRQMAETIDHIRGTEKEPGEASRSHRSHRHRPPAGREP